MKFWFWWNRRVSNYNFGAELKVLDFDKKDLRLDLVSSIELSKAIYDVVKDTQN